MVIRRGERCHGNQIPYLLQGTMLEPPTFHIGRGGAPGRLGSSSRVYSHQTISDSRNDHSFSP
jgi:hypothetical protein